MQKNRIRLIPGDTVTVEIPVTAAEGADMDAATLTAQAESPGHAGETILLRNPLTGRRFSSRVTGVGRAVMKPERSLKNREAIPDARP